MKRDNVYMSLIDVNSLYASATSDLLRLAAWLDAKVPKFTDEDNFLAWKYRLSCSIMRSIKRGKRKAA